MPLCLELGRPASKHCQVLALGLCLALTMGCGDESSERPPYAGDDCGGEICVQEMVSGGPTGRIPSMGTQGSSDAGTRSVVNGSVLVFTSPDLSQTRSLGSEEARVSTVGGDSVETQGGRFEVAVEGPSPIWLSVRATSEQAGLLDTWMAVDEGAGTLMAPIVELGMLEEVTQAFVNDPVLLDPERGHAILVFSDAQGTPVAGVSVEVRTGVAAYDVGVSFSDSLGETDVRGAALLVNLSASTFPGASERLTVVKDGEERELELHMSRGAITLLSVVL